MPALVNVCVLLMAVFLVFAIMGVSLFMGKFYFCNNNHAEGHTDCTGAYENEGYLVPSVWANPGLDGFGSYSFDNLAG